MSPAPRTAPTRPTTGATHAGERPPRRRGRRRILVGLLLLLALLSWDLARPPRDQVSAHLLLAAIDGYQATLSKAFARGGARCRFRPSCSHYAEGAIRKDGALVGSARAAWRIARCGPWTPAGTVDPP